MAQHPQTSLDPFAQFNPEQSQKQYSRYERKKLNLLEKATITIALLILIGITAFGFISQSARNRDTQRAEDIRVVLQAIDSFYVNSNLVPSQRAYPIAECSEKLNEVDFEFTLRQYLGGVRVSSDPHAYILPSEFPNDPWGTYDTILNDRDLELRACPKVFNETTLAGSTIYADGAKSCNFNQRQNRYKQCYLYTSSNNGDSFELAYYSEAQGNFVIYSRFREEPIRVSQL
jgi:type II secretory pathway pseudopilin PulG